MIYFNFGSAYSLPFFQEMSSLRESTCTLPLLSSYAVSHPSDSALEQVIQYHQS